MAVREYWIQLENHPWDTVPWNIDRQTGRVINPHPVTRRLVSPVTGVVRDVKMFRPLAEDALILRRYTPNWAAPADQKVNPWDLNEPDPTDRGTMGTIPGPTIEAELGDTVLIHFRNLDRREGKELNSRVHSLHTHGLVYDSRYDGAFPLAAPDPEQPVGNEAPLWESVGEFKYKRGDRVPPGATFTYVWHAAWPTNVGIFEYHDHSICDVVNISRGAIGFVVVHDPGERDDVVIRRSDLPDGSPTGSPIVQGCLYAPTRVPTLPNSFGPNTVFPGAAGVEINPADLDIKFDDDLLHATITPGTEPLCLPFFRNPPARAQHLILFHSLLGSPNDLLNGRAFIGNTPTFVTGLDTRNRFGVGAMGSDFHTFHLHGHRWVLQGPRGVSLRPMERNPQDIAVSQFEDVRTFGPSDSFQMSIPQGSFFGSVFPWGGASGLGEWHLHCHVLAHMMNGMMSSFMVIRGGELALLPNGAPCPESLSSTTSPTTGPMHMGS